MALCHPARSSTAWPGHSFRPGVDSVPLLVMYMLPIECSIGDSTDFWGKTRRGDAGLTLCPEPLGEKSTYPEITLLCKRHRQTTSKSHVWVLQLASAQEWRCLQMVLGSHPNLCPVLKSSQLGHQPLWSRDKPLPSCPAQIPHQQNIVVFSQPYVWSGFYAAIVTTRNKVTKIVTHTRTARFKESPECSSHCLWFVMINFLLRDK